MKGIVKYKLMIAYLFSRGFSFEMPDVISAAHFYYSEMLKRGKRKKKKNSTHFGAEMNGSVNKINTVFIFCDMKYSA